MICEAGDHRIDIHRSIMITHGTSLCVITRVAECIQESDLHNINPTKDWKKGKKRDLHNYYAFADTDELECASCVRLLYNTNTVIIEYLYTVPESRGLGVGTTLINFCTTLFGNRALHVIATEDACAYWMKLGFIWDKSKDTKSINEFDDTYLLSHCSAPVELAVAAAHSAQ